MVLGDAGRGLTTVAAGVIATICSVEPVKAVGRGSGIDDDAWRTKVAVMRDAMYRVRDDRGDPSRVLRRIGSPDLVVMASFLAQCAVRRTPVLVDGLGSLAAALCAHMMAPGAGAWWMVASQSGEPTHRHALKALHATPLLQMNLCNGLGAAGVMAVPLLEHACRLMNAKLGNGGGAD